jgi:hypothetical protein
MYTLLQYNQEDKSNDPKNTAVWGSSYTWVVRLKLDQVTMVNAWAV